MPVGRSSYGETLFERFLTWTLLLKCSTCTNFQLALSKSIARVIFQSEKVGFSKTHSASPPAAFADATLQSVEVSFKHFSVFTLKFLLYSVTRNCWITKEGDLIFKKSGRQTQMKYDSSRGSGRSSSPNPSSRRKTINYKSRVPEWPSKKEGRREN